ncbi:FtsB family cell division protein [Rhizobium halophytocola]|uniref:Cell division protein FtsB n=1 Tax=Rhizobium halophytocola TaxID=735519 RepID=A0ABS4DWE4_9HYPH|nr:septum formation initiator family protein [Rhizobium halophytocola]MBP1850023.1 cell division protein FtsB [Rhizobium halophytocola]
MWTRYHKKRKTGRLILPAVTIAFLGYFGYHSVHGEYGLIAAQRFEQVRFERERELAGLVKKRKSLETQVQLMSDGSLERDMIDEEARYQLNVSRPDEIVIFNSYMD